MSDPEERRKYDEKWVQIKKVQRTQQEAEKRQAEAAEKERKSAAEEKASKQKEESRRQQLFLNLQARKSECERDIFEINRVVRKLTAEMKRIREMDEEDIRKERERNSWWTYFTAPIYGKRQEPEDLKSIREAERLQRLASKRIKGTELRQNEAKLKSLQDALKDVNSKLNAEKQREEEVTRAAAAKRREQLRKEEEARKRAEEEQWRERWAQIQKEQAERAAKEAREAEKAREVQERKRRAAAEAKLRVEIEERAKARKEEEARKERARAAASSFSSYRTPTSRKSTCRHSGFWPKIEGSHTCGNCHSVQRRFAFKCPGCSMVACANCRQSLRGEKRGPNPTSRRGQGQGRSDYTSVPDYDYTYWDYD